MKSKIPACTLCRKNTTTFHPIEDTMREIFDVLRLKLNSNPTEEQIICLKCSKTVENLLDFKSQCLYTDDYLSPLVNEGEVDFKKICLEISDIHAGKTDTTMKGYEACQCCMLLVKRESFLPLTEVKKDTLLTEVLTVYFPEFKTLHVITGSGICKKCTESLKAYYEFVHHLNSGVDRIISAGVNNPEPAVLEPTTSKTDDGGSKKVKKSFQHHRTSIKKSPGKKKKTRNFLCPYCPFKTNTHQKLQQHQLETHPGKAKFVCDICSYATNNRELLKQHENTHRDGQLYKCETCSYKAKHRSIFKKHLFVHRNPDEIKTLKCEKCSYATYRKDLLDAHKDTHKALSERKSQECPICSMKVTTKISRHMLLHTEELGEGNVFKCTLCLYATVRKDSLRRHSLIHKSNSEVKTFNCDKCPFKTKLRFSLKSHMLSHMTTDEVKMYSCDICSYATKYRGGLQSHIRTHKSFAEVPTYKCYHCPFKTKIKKSLEPHMLMHRRPEEITMHKCKVCSFKSKSVRGMKKHVINAHYDELYA